MAIVMIIFIIAILLMQLNSKKQALKGIKYDYNFSKKHIEQDEETELISIITNESRRFIPYIRMVESLPKGAKPMNQNILIREDTMGLGYLYYDSSIYLLARSQLKRKLKLTFGARGRYVFGGAVLRGGDFLGLTEEREKFQELREVIVYPKPINAPELQQIMGGFLGDMSVRRFMMEDPILTIGTREYTGKEPLKQMSWKHTARMNQMMVKQFDYTTEMVVTVFLDISAVLGKTLIPDQFENCFSVTRSVCQFLEQKKIPFEFTTNALIEGIEIGNTQLVKNLGKNHLRGILEKLGRAAYGTTKSYESVIEDLMTHQEKNRSTIIITPVKDAKKQKLAAKITERTTGVLLFIYGEDFEVGGDGS